jgi:hypothetical protein
MDGLFVAQRGRAAAHQPARHPYELGRDARHGARRFVQTINIVAGFSPAA